MQLGRHGSAKPGTRASAIVLGVVLALGGLAGCSGGDSKPDGKKANVTKPFVSDGKLPDGFPDKDVPLPDGKVKSARDSVGPNNDKGWSVVFEVPGNVSTADAKFVKQLKSKKFEVDRKPSSVKGKSIQRQFQNSSYTVSFGTSNISDTKSLVSMQVTPISG